jgi:N-acetylglucosaminyldiphosphoundecaprenol N-acetyl-beta-D-mannosaminyltransferase
VSPAPDAAARGHGVSRTRVMGAPIGVLTEEEAVTSIVGAAAAGRGGWTITANLDHVRRFQREALTRQLLEEADLVVADGMPLVWASRLVGDPLPERIAGSDMVWSLCERAASRRVPAFLLGGNPGAAEGAAAALRERYPGLEIRGTLCPPFGFEEDPAELTRIEREVRAAEPGIVLVGLGFPKQDLLIRELRASLPGASFVGVGISFSFIAGDLARAPGWASALGLEWAYRLLQEPRRLLRRYLVDGIPFALALFASALRYRLGLGGGGRWGPTSAA